ncbi:MAG: peptide-binding protein [Lentisphaeria bacterium]|nr:peptide-binding protein [Lentisphaeria bacterium]
MNNNGLKFLLTLLFLAVAGAGYFITTALDRLRESNYALADAMRELKSSAPRSPQKEQPKQPSRAAGKAVSPIANAAFYASAAVPGGRMIQAVEAETGNLNPLTSNEAMAAAFNGLCSSSLAERNYSKPELFEPLMAESWQISADRKSYRIKLRKNIFWHDFTDPVTGKRYEKYPVTSEDFKFFVDTVKNKDVNCAPLRVYYQHLDTIEIHNRYEFTVKWNKAYYGSLASTLGMSPLPRHFYAPDGKFDGKKFNDDHRRNRMIVGCGPYIFVKWEKGRRLIFRRNKDYFGAAYGVSPSIEYLVYEIIKHPNTRFQAFMGGNLDRLGLLPDQYIKRTNTVEFQNGKYKKYRYLLPQYNYIGYNQKNPIFRDKRVRQALTLLVDRERIKKEIYHGLAETAVTPFMPGSAFQPSDLQPWPYSPERAKKLLAEAGWRDTDGDGILDREGKKFTFTMMQISGSAIQQRLMPMLKESFAQAGIDMKIRNVEWSVYIQNLNSRSYDVCCLGWSSSFDPDLYQVWHSSQIAGEGSNHISYSNGELDKLLEEMQTCFDMSKRIALGHRIARLLHDEQPYTFLFFPNSLTALSGRYRNVQLFPSGLPNEVMYTPQGEQLRIPGL